jgi:hypothetical protein
MYTIKNKEIWKPIINYEGLYEISNYGRVKSFIKHNGINERILMPQKYRTGYLYVVLCKNKSHKNYLIHKLVLETFIGPCLVGKESCHNDGNRSNNLFDNLRYDSHKRNCKDKTRHGTIQNQNGLKNPNVNPKLNDDIVVEIRMMYKNGIKIKDIANKFKISHSCISHIVHNRSWMHI